MDPSNIPEGIVADIGAFGLLAWIIWYSLKTALPKSVDRIVEATDRVARSQEAAAEKTATAHAAVEKTLGRLTVALLYHDATVRGENPEVLGSSEELLQKVMS